MLLDLICFIFENKNLAFNITLTVSVSSQINGESW